MAQRPRGKDSSSEDVNFHLLLLPRSPPLWEISDVIYPFLGFILFLHLLVIYVHTWVHVPSATPSDALWAVVASIALSGVTMLSSQPQYHLGI